MTTGSGYGQPQPYGRPGYGAPGHPGPGYLGPVAGRAHMRASDTDRDRAVDFLKVAFTEGRLTKDDYDARVGHALGATTYADLDHVMADLPTAAMPQRPRTSDLAVASMICGLAQLIAGPLATVPAIVLGYKARAQIRRTGQQGSGMATAGLVLGWAGAAFTLLLFLGILLLAVAFTGGGPMHPPVHPGP